MSDEDRSARWTLARIAEPGDSALGKAVTQHGAAEVLDRLRARASGLTAESSYLVRLESHDEEEQLRRLTDVDGRFVVPGDAEWPTQLADLGTTQPLGLFLRGRDLRLAAVRSVAVVGARAATDYGAHVAAELGADLAARGWVVVSGGAYGIDAAAHRGALAGGGATVAVLACGVDVTYPRGQAALLERIAGGEGVVVSELPPGSTPTRPRFLTRNRVIAAVSRGTVVVEAAYRSGALNTASSAASLGRFVMAVPGPVTSSMSAGAHRLMQREPPARLVTGADDVVEEVGSIGELAPEPLSPRRARDGLDPETLRVIEAVPARGAVSAGAVSHAAGLEEGLVVGALHRLMLAGLVDRTGEGWSQTERARDFR
jgi:DNA processing protein